MLDVVREDEGKGEASEERAGERNSAGGRWGGGTDRAESTS